MDCNFILIAYHWVSWQLEVFFLPLKEKQKLISNKMHPSSSQCTAVISLPQPYSVCYEQKLTATNVSKLQINISVREELLHQFADFGFHHYPVITSCGHGDLGRHCGRFQGQNYKSSSFFGLACFWSKNLLWIQCMLRPSPVQICIFVYFPWPQRICQLVPPLHYLYRLSYAGPAANPSWHCARGGIHPRQVGSPSNGPTYRDKQSFTLTFTPTGNLVISK